MGQAFEPTPDIPAGRQLIQAYRNSGFVGLALGIALLVQISPVGARTLISGHAEVIDGDSLSVGGNTVRLFGVDAPELEQICMRAGERLRCGELAAGAVRDLIAGRQVGCEPMGYTRVGVAVARCRVVDDDLGRRLVQQGWALAFRRHSDAYALAQESAARSRAGLWAMSFASPWLWRANQQPASDKGERYLDRIADDHEVLIADEASGPQYKERLNIAYLWSNVLLLAVAAGGFWLTARQVRIGTDQARASFLMDLNNRIQSDEFSGLVNEFSSFVDDVRRRQTETAPDGPIGKAYREELMRLHDERAERYAKMMRLCWFLEGIGYNVGRRSYIRFADIYELIGGFILYSAAVFKPHILDLRKRAGDDKLYEYAVSLFEAVERRRAADRRTGRA